MNVSKCLINAHSVVTTYLDRLDAYVHTDTLWRRMVGTAKVILFTIKCLNHLNIFWWLHLL